MAVLRNKKGFTRKRDWVQQENNQNCSGNEQQSHKKY
jgi:hypothetical protein